MNTCIRFETPDKLALQGIWLGAPKASTVYIFLHGLYSNLFSQAETAELLVAPGTASLLFNNRGNGYVSKLRRRSTSKPSVAILGGSHETFTDARHDIAGAVAFAKSRGARRIILVGHSTGCQKAIWYLANKPDSAVQGAVLLAPLSDYAGIRNEMSARAYATALKAVKEIAKKKPHALLPVAFSPVPCDAQRWLSLYTPESVEEIFGYASGAEPTTLRKAKVPLLALFASDDQYADRPARHIADWLAGACPKNPIDARIIAADDHGFSGKASTVARAIRLWAQEL